MGSSSIKAFLPIALKTRLRFFVEHRHGMVSNPDWQTRFVIFGQGRSGSTLLVNLLNQHPGIFADGELLNVTQRGGQVIFPF